MSRYIRGPIWDPISQSGHAASLEDFSVLDRTKNDFDLLIYESLLILRDRPSFNFQHTMGTHGDISRKMIF